MILDEQALFSNNQAVTADAASTNIVKLGTGEFAVGTPIPIFIQVTEAFNNLTSLAIKVQTATDAAFTTPVELASQTILLANLTKGAESSLNFLPKGNLGYIRLYYDVTGTAPSTGKILAGIVAGHQGHHMN